MAGFAAKCLASGRPIAHAGSMASTPAALATLAELLDDSVRPIYAVDPRREIVYGNAALARWLGLPRERIVGRYVEYHSESEQSSAADVESAGPLPGICPPPQAFAAEQCVGTVSCVDRDGRLLHRRADFLPLASAEPPCGVLAVLATTDMSAEELTAELSSEPTADELHRAIRRFHREQSRQYAVESLLGGSSPMRKVRSQVAAAAASGANVMVCGPRGSGRAHVARAIHYQASGDAGGRLVPIDCEVLSEDLWRRTLNSLQGAGDSQQRTTLLAANLDRLSESLQSQWIQAIHERALAVRIVATAAGQEAGQPAAGEGDAAANRVDPALWDAVSTITIHVPRLADRLEDLPLLTQCFLESCNQAGAKQVGSVGPEALDRLALYGWPGELDELREVIAAAHEAATSHEITPADLPAIVHHAAHAASMGRREPERIVLDDLLASVEMELIRRALVQADGNKTEAAQLLGITRPRLYRRLVQLGLVSGPAEETEP